MLAKLKLFGTLALVFLVLVLAIAFLIERAHARTLAFTAINLEAIADSTHKILGAYERQATQSKIAISALDDSLKAKPKIVFRAKIKYDTVYVPAAPGTGVTETPEGARSDSFHIEQPPVTVDALVTLPKPAPGVKGTMVARIGISPLTVIPRVSCSTDLFNGLHKAYVALDSLPPGMLATIEDAQADQSVCNARGGISIGLKLPWWVTPAAGVGGFLAGWLLHHP